MAAVLCAAAFAQAQTVSTIYNFAGNGTSGVNPWYVRIRHHHVYDRERRGPHIGDGKNLSMNSWFPAAGRENSST
jgi:hypothetical protein